MEAGAIIFRVSGSFGALVHSSMFCLRPMSLLVNAAWLSGTLARLPGEGHYLAVRSNKNRPVPSSTSPMNSLIGFGVYAAVILVPCGCSGILPDNGVNEAHAREHEEVTVVRRSRFGELEMRREYSEQQLEKDKDVRANWAGSLNRGLMNCR